MATWSNEPITSGLNTPFTSIDDGHQIAVWNVKTGALLRTFPTSEGKISWPVFKWPPSEKYLARVQPGQAISVYEAPGMGMLDKKSIKIEGVKEFEWLPSSDGREMLAYWTPEIINQPARVTLLGIPSRDIIRTKNLFNVAECKLHWHYLGDFLCVKVDRHTKTKKSTFTNLEIFRIKEKDTPVEVIELKEVVVSMAWEPQGDRFSIITTADATQATPRTNITFYGLSKGEFKVLKTAEKKTHNSIYWSPKGRHVVFATLRSSTVWDLEFWDVEFGDENLPQQLAAQEHYGVTDIEWDPTGRYIVTSASAWRHTMENGFIIWDFKGAVLQKKIVEKFRQILWRPRPLSRLSKEQQKKIRKNLKEYSKKFDAEDTTSAQAAASTMLEERRELIREWQEWRKEAATWVMEERRAVGLLPGEKEEEEDVQEWVETVIDEKEEIVD